MSQFGISVKGKFLLNEKFPITNVKPNIDFSNFKLFAKKFKEIESFKVDFERIKKNQIELLYYINKIIGTNQMEKLNSILEYKSLKLGLNNEEKKLLY